MAAMVAAIVQKAVEAIVEAIVEATAVVMAAMTVTEAIVVVYSGTLVKTKIDKFLNVSGSRHCSIEQQCREVALCWRDVPDG